MGLGFGEIGYSTKRKRSSKRAPRAFKQAALRQGLGAPSDIVSFGRPRHDSRPAPLLPVCRCSTLGAARSQTAPGRPAPAASWAARAGRQSSRWLRRPLYVGGRANQPGFGRAELLAEQQCSSEQTPARFPAGGAAPRIASTLHHFFRSAHTSHRIACSWVITPAAAGSWRLGAGSW